MADPLTPSAALESGFILRAARSLGLGLGRLSRPSGALVSAAWYGMIWTLSSQAMVGRPGRMSGSWVLNTGHALLFGLLALGLLLCLPRRDGWPLLRRSQTAIVLGLVGLLGVVDELHQSTVPGRVMSTADVLTDLTGACCVLWICAFTGSSGARETGLRWRLLVCLGACFLAGGVATVSDNLHG